MKRLLYILAFSTVFNNLVFSAQKRMPYSKMLPAIIADVKAVKQSGYYDDALNGLSKEEKLEMLEKVFRQLYHSAITEDAIEKNCTAVASMIIVLDADINSCFRNDWTPLTWIITMSKAYARRLDIQSILNDLCISIIENMGADINKKDGHRETPLRYAISSKNKYMFDYLIAKGADINDENLHGESILYTTLTRNYDEDFKDLRLHFVTQLLLSGADYKDSKVIEELKKSQDSNEVFNKACNNILLPLIKSQLNAGLTLIPSELNAMIAEYSIDHELLVAISAKQNKQSENQQELSEEQKEAAAASTI